MEDFKLFDVASVSPALPIVSPSGLPACALLWKLRRELRTLLLSLTTNPISRITRTKVSISPRLNGFRWFLRCVNETCRSSIWIFASDSNKDSIMTIRLVSRCVSNSLTISSLDSTVLPNMDRWDIVPIITVSIRSFRKIGTWYSTFSTRSGIRVSSIVNPLNRKRLLPMSRNISSILPWCPYRRPLIGRSRLCPRASELSTLLNRQKRGIAKRILCATMCPYKIGGKSYRGIIVNEFSMMP